MVNRDFDVIVVGGGAAGENAGDRAARDGLELGIVEKDLLGGECSYWACMPSKALLRPGEVLASVRRVPGAAEAVTGDIDIAAALKRRDRLAANWDDASQVEWAEGAGMRIVRGHGRLRGERRVAVTASDGRVTEYEAAKAIVVATGTAAAMPDLPGLDEVDVWDNRNAARTNVVPRRLVVLGGGVVGVEMAQAMKTLGSDEVTIVEMEERLVPTQEPAASEALTEALTRRGIVVRTNASAERLARPDAKAPVTVTLDDGTAIETDELLVAIGRRPATNDLGLDTVGLQPGEYVQVDDHMCATAVEGGWLYAVGDVNGRSLLTHSGKYQARIAGDHIAGRPVHTTAYGDTKAEPRVIFTDPHIASVGLTAAKAEQAGITVGVVDYDIGDTAGAATHGRGIRGPCRLVIDEDRRVLVGATFVGPGAGELLHAATIAIVADVTVDELWHAIPSFPTMSEVWLRLLEAYGL